MWKRTVAGILGNLLLEAATTTTSAATAAAEATSSTTITTEASSRATEAARGAALSEVQGDGAAVQAGALQLLQSCLGVLGALEVNKAEPALGRGAVSARTSGRSLFATYT
jgi:hypothetical protein